MSDNIVHTSDATFEAGRCFEALKKPSQAIKRYEHLLEKYPDSDKVPAAQKRIEELN